MLNNALKTASKNTIQKQEKITGDLFDSEIAHKITKKLSQDTSDTVYSETGIPIEDIYVYRQNRGNIES